MATSSPTPSSEGQDEGHTPFDWESSSSSGPSGTDEDEVRRSPVDSLQQSPEVPLTETVQRKRFWSSVDLGHFWTSQVTPPEEQMEFSAPGEKVKVLPLSELKKKMGRKLDLKEIEPTRVVKFSGQRDRFLHQQDRWARFFVWLKRNKEEAFQGEEKVQFVCSSSEIEKFLMTEVRPEEEWSFFAVRIQGVVFLRCCWEDKKNNNKVRGGHIFKEIALGRDPLLHGFNRFEVPVTVSKFNIGVKAPVTLLVHCSDVCFNEEGRKVLVLSDTVWWTRDLAQKARNEMQSRYMGFWAKAVSRGVEGVVMGHRDYRKKKEILKGVNFFSPWMLWFTGEEEAKKRGACYNFLQNVLNFVKEELPFHDPKIVKKFRWDPAERILLCEEVEKPEELRRVQERIWVDWLQENVFDA